MKVKWPVQIAAQPRTLSWAALAKKAWQNLFPVLLLLLFLTVLASFSERTVAQMRPNGDVLGANAGADLEAYKQQAVASLKSPLLDATQPSFALITFDKPLDPLEVAALIAPIKRLNAMVVGISSPIALPEPLIGESRAAPLYRGLSQLEKTLGGQVAVPKTAITAVIVWDLPPVLAALAEKPNIWAVEALPPDASWGSFGIQPVPTPAAIEITPGLGSQ
ncbi:hypothetical protein [Corynebacterium caspium]|uniref:hypothetical protein n=1 Tax=Corynebacterium caspium TaxID=234828 RepID=UPI00035F539D|nr:hypothetical protein [Corynebacterium caspium]WKD59014.1 hypothetical protein CCASP_03050 [Corynebacterium caspium DSM 44850]